MEKEKTNNVIKIFNSYKDNYISILENKIQNFNKDFYDIYYYSYREIQKGAEPPNFELEDLKELNDIVTKYLNNNK